MKRFKYDQKSLKTNPKDCLQKLLDKIDRILRLLIRIWSVNRSKGVKLGFEYDHVAPSGFGVAPINRVPTAMFSLVRIWPMFEQEAPKWRICELCSSSTYVWAVLCIQLSLVPIIWAWSILNEQVKQWNDGGPELSGMPALLYCL